MLRYGYCFVNRVPNVPKPERKVLRVVLLCSVWHTVSLLESF